MMYHQLTREQRYTIYLGIKEGKSQKAIARQIFDITPTALVQGANLAS
jgi:IS30 family transposase|nr:helix-turn-helix domain-containing protein [Odoribacter splanchnicus]